MKLFISSNLEGTHTSFAGVGPISQTKLKIQVINQYLSKGKEKRLPIANVIHSVFRVDAQEERRKKNPPLQQST